MSQCIGSGEVHGDPGGVYSQDTDRTTLTQILGGTYHGSQVGALLHHPNQGIQGVHIGRHAITQNIKWLWMRSSTTGKLL